MRVTANFIINHAQLPPHFLSGEFIPRLVANYIAVLQNQLSDTQSLFEIVQMENIIVYLLEVCSWYPTFILHKLFCSKKLWVVCCLGSHYLPSYTYRDWKCTKVSLKNVKYGHGCGCRKEVKAKQQKVQKIWQFSHQWIDSQFPHTLRKIETGNFRITAKSSSCLSARPYIQQLLN